MTYIGFVAAKAQVVKGCLFKKILRNAIFVRFESKMRVEASCRQWQRCRFREFPEKLFYDLEKQEAESWQMMKTGMVLEGGAMRGMYTAGVTDVLCENEVWVDGVLA